MINLAGWECISHQVEIKSIRYEGTLIEQAKELAMWPLVDKLKTNLTLSLPTHIRVSCWLLLKSQSRASKKSNGQNDVSLYIKSVLELNFA